MRLITSQQKIFPSVFIAETVDLTLELELQEKGVVAALGKLSIGNPYYAQIINSAREPLLSTNVNVGGNPDNEIAYHIRDYFSSFPSGKMAIGRVLGADSVTKVLVANSTSIQDFASATNINIFGANNIKDWQDTAIGANAIELVITACPTYKTTVTVVNEDDYMTVTVYDNFGNKVYEVSGGSKFDSVDDSGEPNYIGSKANNKILIVKVDSAHAGYSASFSVTRTYDAGLVSELGAKNYVKANDVLDSVIENCDYAITAGLTDIAAIAGLRALTTQAEIPIIIDIKKDTRAEAEAFKASLNAGAHDTCSLWQRGKFALPAGDLRIGISGWFVGQCVLRNQSRMSDAGGVEYRVSGIAGKDYQVPYSLSEPLDKLSDDDRTQLVKSRINTIAFMNNRLVVNDILSGEPKNVALRVFPVSEANHFINRYIARIMIQKLFKNRNEAKDWIVEEVRKLFERAERLNYFDNDQDVKYEFAVTKEGIDKLRCSYTYVAGGVFRNGIVSGNIVKEIKG